MLSLLLLPFLFFLLSNLLTFLIVSLVQTKSNFLQ